MTRPLVPPIVDEDAGAGPENATGLHSYDEQKWRALLSSDGRHELSSPFPSPTAGYCRKREIIAWFHEPRGPARPGI